VRFDLLHPDIHAVIIAHPPSTRVFAVTGVTVFGAFDRLEVAEYSAQASIAARGLGSTS
jgi:hypothetical protein